MDDAANNDELPGTLSEARALLGALRQVAAHGAGLFSAELRRAGLSLGLILAAGIALAVLVVSVWLLAMAALVVVAVNAGVSMAASLALFALANAAAAAGCVALMRGLSANLGFDATRRAFIPPSEEHHVHTPEPA